MAKIDFRKQLKELYDLKAAAPRLLEVPPRRFLVLDGQGDPNATGAISDAIGTLYGLAYTIKFTLKKAGSDIDYVVPPPEALWWMEGEEGFDPDRPDRWRWQVMLPQPDHVTAADLAAAVGELVRKKKDSPALSQVRLETLHEGLSAQVVHVGPYETEATTSIPALHEFIAAQGRKMRGRHHEIYLTDPRRTAPEKNKTILRQPVE